MIDRYWKGILFGILVLATVFRLYAVSWDQGYHLHPDERAIVLAVVEMTYPASVDEFFSSESPWNPEFFAYGSFPFYLLRIAGDITGFLLAPSFAMYDGINLVGRILSALFDIGTILLLFVLCRRFFSITVGLLAAFFYAVSVLPIQLSHFYAVDTILTFFMLAAVYLSLRLEKERTVKSAVLLGACTGLALATKVSAILLAFPIGVALLYMLIRRTVAHHHVTFKHALVHTCILSLLITATALATFTIAQPYAILDTERFLRDIETQSGMTKDAFVFPYTLQYALKTPYVHELYNIFFFGLGPLLATASFLGFFYIVYRTIKEAKLSKQARNLILLSLFIIYFLTVGGFKVGFMRYLLPIYPLFALFAAIFTYRVHVLLKKHLKPSTTFIFYILFFIFLLVWPLSFLNMYTKPNTRVQATDWILKNIPEGSAIATEHWDDSLPLSGQERYDMLTLPLYEADTDEKWRGVNATLADTDYIIVASNRLYTPLMKLTDCDSLPPGRCYRTTADYYQELFSGTGEFKKVAEFQSFPTVPLINIKINDQSADESFTVYDHPVVMIFQKQ